MTVLRTIKGDDLEDDALFELRLLAAIIDVEDSLTTEELQQLSI